MDFCKVTQTNGALLWYRTTISLSSLWSTEIKSQGSLWTFSLVLVFTKGCCKNKWPCQKSNVKPLLGVYYENTEYKVHLAFQNQINLGAFFSKVAGKVSFLPRRVIFFLAPTITLFTSSGSQRIYHCGNNGFQGAAARGTYLTLADI